MEYTPEKIEEIKINLSKVPAFQWIKTENTGQVVHYQDVVNEGGILFVEFDNSTRINFDLLGEFLLPLVEGEGTALQLNEHLPIVGKVSLATAKVLPETPIHSLLKKQKPNMVDMDIKLEINLPPRELYTVLTQSFEDAEKDVLEYIVRDINIETIKESVREALKNYYQ